MKIFLFLEILTHDLLILVKWSYGCIFCHILCPKSHQLKIWSCYDVEYEKLTLKDWNGWVLYDQLLSKKFDFCWIFMQLDWVKIFLKVRKVELCVGTKNGIWFRFSTSKFGARIFGKPFRRFHIESIADFWFLLQKAGL